MTTRDRELERLRVVSPCRSSWDDMRCDARRRYCVECERHVYDFAQLTAREVAGLVEATGGALCARVTRDGFGRLVTLPPPPAAELSGPPGSRRSVPLAAVAVAAVLGLGGAAAVHAADAAVATPLAAEQEAGKRPAESPPERTEDAGFLSGTLATDGGEPIPRAEVRLYNRLGGREFTGLTDERGDFSFISLPAGVYELAASIHYLPLAAESNVLLRAGEAGRIGLTVPSATWRRIVAGAPIEVPLMGETIVVLDDSLRKLYAESGLVVFGVAGKSVVVQQGEYTWQVRTDLVLSSVVKGESRGRVVSVVHEQMADEPPASRLQPGDRVLAFLDPHQAEDAANGSDRDGYVAHAPSGFKKLSEAEAAAYGRRLTALARLAHRGEARPADLLEWLVATTEDPATRGQAVGELDTAVAELASQAERRGLPAALYARELRDVLTDYLGAGGGSEGETDPAVLAAFLTDAQRERLTAALLRTTHIAEGDMGLYRLVRRWHGDRALPWLLGRIKAGEPSGWSVRGALSTAAKDLGDKGLEDLVEAGWQPIEAIGDKLVVARDDGARQRLEAEARAAEEELRQRFLAALGRRPGT